MNKHERFKQAILYLKGSGLATTNKSIAEAMGASASNVTTAINTGNPKVLTTQFLARFANAYEGVFHIDWLLNGTGDMLQNNGEEESSYKQETECSNNNGILDRLLDAKDETIEALKQQLKAKDELLETKNQLIASLRRQIPYGPYDENGFHGVAEKGEK